MLPSSSGLGRMVLIHVTPVRIRLGAPTRHTGFYPSPNLFWRGANPVGAVFLFQLRKKLLFAIFFWKVFEKTNQKSNQNLTKNYYMLCLWHSSFTAE